MKLVSKNIIDCAFKFLSNGYERTAIYKQNTTTRIIILFFGRVETLIINGGNFIQPHFNSIIWPTLISLSFCISFRLFIRSKFTPRRLEMPNKVSPLLT